MRYDGFSLKGRVALVTGATGGIGLGIAHALADAGARVVLHGRDRERLAAARDGFAPDQVAQVLAFDLNDQAADGFAALAGIDIDILVNNAGVQLRMPMLEVDLLAWQQVIDTNLTGAFLAAQAVVPAMRRRGGGKIINITSLAAEVSRARVAPYTAAKGALKALTRAMAVEWAPFGIQVNAIGPGHIATAMTADTRADPAFDDWVRRTTPARRWGEVSDLAGAAIFLASPASDFVTGQTIYVDGGFLAAM